MENIIYERSYIEEHRIKRENNTDQLADAILDRAKTTVFKNYDLALKAIPKVVNPESKKAYDLLLSQCDRIAKRWGGEIKGEVRYDTFEAVIDLKLPFAEFAHPEDRQTLLLIATAADSVTFSSMDNGWVNAHLYFRYFEEIVSPDERDNILTKLIENDSELVEMLHQHLLQNGENPDESEN